MSEPKQLKEHSLLIASIHVLILKKNQTVFGDSLHTSLGSLLVKRDAQSLSAVIMLLCQVQRQAETCFVVSKTTLNGKSCFFRSITYRASTAFE